MLKCKHSISFSFFAAAMLYAAPSFANTTQDSMIENSRMCLKHFSREERQNGIPKHLLFAVSSTESGRWHKSAGVALPWPWTVNAEGKGYYFDNKSDAIAAVTKFRAQGMRSIDVGCMQVNLMHHGKAFGSVSDAFDPEKNVAYAATFLRKNYEELQSWKKAVAAYHSRTESLGDNYFSMVKKNWRRALELVGSTTSYAQSAYLRSSAQSLRDVRNAPTAKEYNVNDFGNGQTVTSPAPQKRSEQEMESPKMNAISVASAQEALPQDSATTENTKQEDVLVIRPSQDSTHSNQPVKLALAKDSATSSEFVYNRKNNNQEYRAHSYKDISIKRTTSASLTNEPQTPIKRGPNFIFQ